MILPFMFGQGVIAPVGNYGGITMSPSGRNWTATPWIGGRNLGGITLSRQADAYQRALIVLISQIANDFFPDQDPDN